MSKSKREGDRLATRILVATVLSLLVLGGVFYWILLERVDVDKGNFCPPDSGPAPRTTVIVLDGGPNLARKPVDILRDDMRSGTIPFVRYERVLLFAVEKDGMSATPLFELCHPGSEAEAKAAIEDPKDVEQRRIKQFEPRLFAAAEQAGGSGHRPAPLVEALSDVSKRRQHYFRGRSEAARLVIYSPFVQRSDGMLQTAHCESSYESFTRGHFAREYPIALRGVETLAHMVALDGEARTVQRPSLRVFWEKLLGVELLGSGAVSIDAIKPLPICDYPTREDEARRHIERAKAPLRGCQIATVNELVAEARRYSAEVVSTSGIEATIRKRKGVCDELRRLEEERRREEARRREELRARQAAEDAVSTRISTPAASVPQ